MSPVDPHAAESRSPDASAEATAGGSAELFWDAFRYVSGDDVLPDGSLGPRSARFEERLAWDQAAREAVAQVVTLSAAINSAACDVAPAIASPASSSDPAPVAAWSAGSLARLAPLAWMSVGAAAMWLVGLGLSSRATLVPLDPPAVVVAPPSDYPAGLAAASSTFPTDEAIGDAPLIPASDPDSELAMLDAYLSDDADDEAASGVPGWMLQAVSDSRRQTTPTP